MIRFFVLSLLISCFSAHADIKVAVASNFKTTLIKIAENYERQTGQKILISSASTGILYNQIQHGAPFDLFLSADSDRATLMEHSARGVAGSRFTYARGVLAFWVPDSPGIVDADSLQNFKGVIAIANPKLAPYGLAAQQTLQSLDLWDHFNYVQGTNISQAYQFIDSGNIKAGFVAYSLLLENNARNFFVIPGEYHQPILQQGVLLQKASDPKAVRHFIQYITSDPVQALIRSKGYM